MSCNQAYVSIQYLILFIVVMVVEKKAFSHPFPAIALTRHTLFQMPDQERGTARRYPNPDAA
jgi:hypothetical protein